jgi:hypothetical protein
MNQPKQCDCCGQMRRTVQRCWYGAVETFACAKCRGGNEQDELDQYDEDIRYFTEVRK